MRICDSLSLWFVTGLRDVHIPQKSMPLAPVLDSAHAWSVSAVDKSGHAIDWKRRGLTCRSGLC